MLDQLVGQVKRLFSSKTNAGRLVATSADRLHGAKQLLLATCIVLLLGYSNFRAHFVCQGVGKVDTKTLTNFCWINGTSTLVDGFDANDASESGAGLEPAPATGDADVEQQADSGAETALVRQTMPHVGLLFGHAADGRHRSIGHGYMRSMWALLIVMAVCSFVAQRRWASIFRSDLLRALLALPAADKLPAVVHAQRVRPYAALMRLPPGPDSVAATAPTSAGSSFASCASSASSSAGAGAASDGSSPGAKQAPARAAYAAPKGRAQGRWPRRSLEARERERALNLILASRLPDKRQLLAQLVDITGTTTNSHANEIEYYPNQVLYALLSTRTPNLLARLHLGRKLVGQAALSFLLSAGQLGLTWLGLGNVYLTYGLDYVEAALVQLRHRLAHPRSPDSGVAFDYHLSSRVFPTVALCPYRQYGIEGTERITVHCTVAINEICAKLFAVIWWFLAVSLAVELVALVSMLICALNCELYLSWRYWPRARHAAKLVATFRARYLAELSTACAHALQPMGPAAAAAAAGPGPKGAHGSAADEKRHLAAQDEIRVYEEGWLARALGLLPGARGRRPSTGSLGPGQGQGRRPAPRPRADTNVYYLFYLIYLRLGKSRNSTEHVIEMCAEALERYLDNLTAVHANGDPFAQGHRNNRDDDVDNNNNNNNNNHHHHHHHCQAPPTGSRPQGAAPNPASPLGEVLVTKPGDLLALPATISEVD